MNEPKPVSWRRTADGKPRGYIDMPRLRELWFHTGTTCNLRCPDCYEHSSPDNQRLEEIAMEDVRPIIEQAVARGVEKFSFTGGEPFMNPNMVPILAYALTQRPCLVLTNGTQPLRQKMAAVKALADKPYPLSFRISLDAPNPQKHDARRGKGMFALALQTLAELYRSGFQVAIARRKEDGEDSAATDAAYATWLESVGVPVSVPIIAFPDLRRTCTPEITEDCMRTYQTAETRARFMCAFSRMAVKQNGGMRIYACTLVDDRPEFDLGGNLAEACSARVMLAHPRCFACFAGGTSCSEL